MGKTTIFYLPSLTIQNRGAGGQGGRPVEGGGVSATRCTATTGKWGKMKRSSRATDSAPYLGQGQPVEVAPRHRPAAGYGGRWWCAWGLGRQGGSVGVVRGEVGSRSGPFIGAGRSVWMRIFEL
jgi:hypothetical protein